MEVFLVGSEIENIVYLGLSWKGTKEYYFEEPANILQVSPLYFSWNSKSLDLMM